MTQGGTRLDAWHIGPMIVHHNWNWPLQCFGHLCKCYPSNTSLTHKSTPPTRGDKMTWPEVYYNCISYPSDTYVFWNANPPTLFPPFSPHNPSNVCVDTSQNHTHSVENVTILNVLNITSTAPSSLPRPNKEIIIWNPPSALIKIMYAMLIPLFQFRQLMLVSNITFLPSLSGVWNPKLDVPTNQNLSRIGSTIFIKITILIFRSRSYRPI